MRLPSGNQTWQLKTQHLQFMFPFKAPFIGESPVLCLITGKYMKNMSLEVGLDYGTTN
jgi:hypothetical protein